MLPDRIVVGRTYLLALFRCADLTCDFGFSSMRAVQIAVAPPSFTRSGLIFYTRAGRSIHSLLATAEQRSSHHTILGFQSRQPYQRCKLSTLRPIAVIMTDDKSHKQATLGYVRDSQQTIGCVHMAFYHIIPVVSAFNLSFIIANLSHLL